jgi:histidine triad (HIT) family protein
MSAYDPDNIFAKVLRGEIPSHRVFEDDTILVMMDIFPQSRGHTLVIPKEPSRNMLDAEPEAVAKVARYLPGLSRAVMAATKADGLRLMQFNEVPSGQTVFHLHFHLIPVYAGLELGRHASAGRADDADLAALAKAIATELGA